MKTQQELLESGYFVNNEYFNKYYELLTKNQNMPKIKFITNSHHIIPRHWFINNNLEIDNSCDNLINLSFKEHMLAHLYLSGCTVGRNKYWNLYAIYLMSGHIVNDCDEMVIEEIKNLDCYQILYSEAISAASNHRKGAKISDETRERMKYAQQQRVQKYGASNIGYKWIHNDYKDYMVPANEVSKYLEDGFQCGRLYRHSDETKQKCKKGSITRKMNGDYESDDFRRKMSEIASNQHHSQESRAKQSQTLKIYYQSHDNPFKGHHHSEETKQLNRTKHIGKKAVNKDGKVKMVNPDEVQSYLEDGWTIGYGKSRK